MIKRDIEIEKDEAVDARTWMIVGVQDVSAWSWGHPSAVTARISSEFVRLVIWYSTPVAVTIYSEPSVTTNVTAEGTASFAEELFPEIDAELYRLRAPYLGPPTPGALPGAGSSPAAPTPAASVAAPRSE